jgi:hypothetical protein
VSLFRPPGLCIVCIPCITAALRWEPGPACDYCIDAHSAIFISVH